MSGHLGDRDRQDIVDALRRLAMIEAVQPNWPSDPGYEEARQDR